MEFHQQHMEVDRGPFATTYLAYSSVMMPDDDRNRELFDGGNKIKLPPSALQWLTDRDVPTPYLFKISNNDPENQRTTHCGVLEFTAEEGVCFVPYWIMKSLQLNEGSTLKVESATLPAVTFAKFKPQSTDFLDLANPKAFLEYIMPRGFVCLTKGDVIPVDRNGKIFEFLVQDLKPADAVCIIDSDMETDFDDPVGYVPPPPKPYPDENADVQEVPKESVPYKQSFIPFVGAGSRLDGKVAEDRPMGKPLTQANGVALRGIPNFEYQPGTIRFTHISRAKGAQAEENGETSFPGGGRTLRDRKE